MTDEVSKVEFIALKGAHATLQAAFNAQAKQLDELEARVANHTENINLLRGDQQRQHTADLTLAGPTAQPVGAYGLIPAALPDNSSPAAAVVEGASAIAVEGPAAAVIDTSDAAIDKAELERATAAAVAAGLAPPTPVEQLSPAAIAAEEAIRRRQEQSQERREKRKAAGR